MEKMHGCIGCFSRGKGTDTPPGLTFSFERCNHQQRIVAPKVTFNFNVSYDTGTFPVTTFTEDTEKLLHMTAPEIFKMAMYEDQTWFGKLARRVCSRKLIIELSQKLTMFRNKVLQWGVRSLVVEEESSQTSAEAENSPVEAGVTSSTRETEGSMGHMTPLRRGIAEQPNFQHKEQQQLERTSSDEAIQIEGGEQMASRNPQIELAMQHGL